MYAAFRSFRSATVPLLRAVGRPDYETKLHVLKLALIVPFVYPATRSYGLAGVALVLLGHTLVVSPVASYVGIGSVEGTFRPFLAVVSYPALGSPSMGMAVLAVRDAIEGAPAVLGSPFSFFRGRACMPRSCGE